MGQLTSGGHELTPHPSDADVIVVNTCSFIDPAKQESIDTILEMAEYKKTGRAQKLIVAGCLVERYRGDIQKNMPEVDAVIGTNELERITALCEGVEPKRQSVRRLPLSRPDAARALHAQAFRLHQDRRGLRSSLHLLRDSAVSREVPQPPLRVGDLGSHAAVLARRARDQPDRPGHHLLRRRLRAQGRPGATARPPGADRNARTKNGFASCMLSQQSHAEAARHHRRARRAGEIHRHAAAARQRPGVEAHEARRQRRYFPQADRAHPQDHPRRGRSAPA